MSTVYINARFLTQPMSGVQRFAIEICLELLSVRKDIVFLSPKNIIHTDIANKLHVKVIGFNKGTLWEQLDLPLFLKKNKNPFLICLANTAPVFYSNYMVCHHDITYIRYPKTLSYKARIWYSILMPMVIKNAKKIITVSEYSKKDISCYYKIEENKIDVVYNSVSDIFNQAEISESTNEKYALLVSSVNTHKNIGFILNAMSNCSLPLKIKLVGGAGGNFSKVALKSSKEIEHVGRVSDEDLVRLYDNAEVFIFPSLYEGFGIPLLEAQSRGCIVLSSNTSSMPEVLLDSALYFSPDDEYEFINVLNKLITEREKYAYLIEKGYENTKRFSWKKSAEKLSNIIEKII